MTDDELLIALFGDDINYIAFIALGFNETKAMLLTMGDNCDPTPYIKRGYPTNEKPI